MFSDPFPLLLALTPLAAYLLLIGTIRLSRRPLVTTAARDGAALAVGISGLMAIGPAELFFPAATAAAIGPLVWVGLLVFYSLVVTLIILTVRPRLIIYGAPAPLVLEPLHRACLLLDSQASVDPQRLQVYLPGLGVRLRVDGQAHQNTSEVVAFEPDLTPLFWRRLLATLRQEMIPFPRSTNYGGIGMICCGALILILLAVPLIQQPGEVLAGFRQWLWR